MYKRRVKYRTDFLLPKNSFFTGMGSVLNLAGSYFEYNYSNSAQEADLKSLYSDWKNVGDDINKSKNCLEPSLK